MTSWPDERAIHRSSLPTLGLGILSRSELHESEDLRRDRDL